MALSKFEYNSFDVTPVASSAFAFNSTPNGLTTAAAGAMNLIKTTTASGVANVDLTHGSNDVVLDGTYDTYLFKLINIHVSAQCEFAVNFSTDGQSSAASKQTTTFNCYHQENGASTEFEYVAADDRANNVGDQQITAIDIGTQNDSGLCAEVFLFSPASTTFMKHFVVKSQYFSHQSTPYSNNVFVGGYVNTTSAVNSVRFLTSTGNFDGTIKMYGITK
tara:strand:+ start:42 stop:701 length:660 start_codon:yes stop_codon:yes gene_type:complete